MVQVPSLTVLDSQAVEREVATLTAIAALLGEVQASPTANTLLDRTKALKTSIDAVKASIDASSVTQLGARTVAQSPAVNIATDQPALPVNQLSVAHDITTSFTRQANTTPYDAGDVVGAALAALTFAGLGKAGGGSVLINGASLKINTGTSPATAWRLHLYSVTPPSALADAATFDLPSGDSSSYLGWIDIPTATDLGSTCFVEVNNIGKQVKLTTADCFAYLQAVSGYTPGSAVVYDIALHTVEV